MWNNRHILQLILVILFLPLTKSSAQEEDRGIILDAVLWTAENDTIYSKLLYTNQYSLQFSVTLSDTSGNPLQHYGPKDLAGFCYYMQDEAVKFISMPNPGDMGRIFLRLVYQGKLQLYQFLEINRSSSVLSFIVSYYIWDTEWKEPPLSRKYEAESLLYHFSDCPELEYKIKTGEYSLIKIETIMREYENCRLTDEYEFFYE